MNDALLGEAIKSRTHSVCFPQLIHFAWRMFGTFKKLWKFLFTSRFSLTFGLSCKVNVSWFWFQRSANAAWYLTVIKQAFYFKNVPISVFITFLYHLIFFSLNIGSSQIWDIYHERGKPCTAVGFVQLVQRSRVFPNKFNHFSSS